MVAGIAIGGHCFSAVAIQTRIHGMGNGGVRGGVALCAADTRSHMARMVKMHMRGQGSTANIAQRLPREHR